MSGMEKDFLEACRACGKARTDFQATPEEKERLYQNCVVLGQDLGKSSYEIERAIEKAVDESYGN